MIKKSEKINKAALSIVPYKTTYKQFILQFHTQTIKLISIVSVFTPNFSTFYIPWNQIITIFFRAVIKLEGVS